MVVLVIDQKAGFLHDRTDPPYTMVAVIMMLPKIVAQQKTFGRAIMHVDSRAMRSGAESVAGSLLLEGVRPVASHTLQAGGQKKLPCMSLRIPPDRFLPESLHGLLAGLFREPLERPLVVSAKVVASDYWQS